MDKVQSIPNQSQIPKNGQASGKFSDSGPSNPQNSDRLWADLGPSNPQNRGQPYIGASRGLSRGLFRLGSERNDRTGAPVGHASTPQFSFVISSHLPPPLSPSLSTRPPAQNKLRTNHFPSHSHSLPLSLFHLICFPFSLYLRQRRSILSHSSTALVHPRTFSNTFLLTFADFFLSFFYIFPECSLNKSCI